MFDLLFSYRVLVLSTLALGFAGCPRDGSPPPATHTGLISIQDMSIAGLPQAGHGLTVQAFFTPLRAPDFEEPRGSDFGCKVSAYDLAREKPPAEAHHGRLTIDGIRGGAIGCEFRAGRGYVCPTVSGQAAASVRTEQGAALYSLDGLQLMAADVGRYLQVSGAARAENNGAFAILDVPSPGQAVVANQRAQSEMFDAQFAIVAGAGPTPRDLYRPFEDSGKVAVSLEPGGDRAFDAFAIEITPGGAFTPDEETLHAITHLEPSDRPLTLGCSGAGGTCGESAATVLRITSTDASVKGLSPVAMPAPEHHYVEISCAFPDRGQVTIPGEAMAFLEAAHDKAPITRIRTAIMREGYGVVSNPAPAALNRTIVLVGHGVLGFSAPAR